MNNRRHQQQQVNHMQYQLGHLQHKNPSQIQTVHIPFQQLTNEVINDRHLQYTLFRIPIRILARIVAIALHKNRLPTSHVDLHYQL